MNDEFEERAAIREYDGGFFRADAEVLAAHDCKVDEKEQKLASVAPENMVDGCWYWLKLTETWSIIQAPLPSYYDLRAAEVRGPIPSPTYL